MIVYVKQRKSKRYMKKIYPISMIMLGLLYGLSVLVFLITKTEVALTIWEIVTILSAIYCSLLCLSYEKI